MATQKQNGRHVEVEDECLLCIFVGVANTHRGRVRESAPEIANGVWDGKKDANRLKSRVYKMPRKRNEMKTETVKS